MGGVQGGGGDKEVWWVGFEVGYGVRYLLEVEQEGALVLAAAVLLHALLQQLVHDGGHRLAAHLLQQLQPTPAAGQ